MHFRVKYQATELPIRLRRRRGMRRVVLSVSTAGRVILTAPKRTPLRWLQAFLERETEWLLHVLDRIGFVSEQQGSIERDQMLEYREHREQAHRLVANRLRFFNAHYQYYWRSVSIRNQRTRWGSCSHAGRLSFHYRILFLPPALQDYLIVHELCHLRELNHSARFWTLVAQTIPEHESRRLALRGLTPHGGERPA